MGIDNIKKFALNHGNQFHARVVSVLRKKNWHVLVSPFYRDIATDKAREADIIAERDLIMFDRCGTFKGGARVRLVVECKFIQTPIIFWFDGKDMPRAENRITEDTILKLKRENIAITEHHWYSEKEVGKLFSAINTEKQTENELFFGAIDKVLNALISYRAIDSIIFKEDRRELVWDKLSTYPIIICNDFSQLYKLPFDGSDKLESLASQKFFQIEVNYSYTQFVNGFRVENPEYFLIDVVDFNFLEEYINTIIKGDINAIGMPEFLYVKE